jgi:hypothetical protein
MIFKYLDLHGMEYLCKNYLKGDYYKGIKINSENFNELYNLILKVYKNKINNFYGIDYKAKDYLKNFLLIKDAIENARMDVSKTIYDMENKMEKDKRINKIAIIYDCFDSEDAKASIGEKGYFAHSYHCFSDLSKKCEFGVLQKVIDGKHPYDNGKNQYDFFLPDRYVESSKKKKRKFLTIEEFCNACVKNGEIIFRKKMGNTELHVKYNGFCLTEVNQFEVLLGCEWFSFEELFKDYEYFDKNNWFSFETEEKILDSRIKSPLSVYGPYSEELFLLYEGEKGYFTDNLDDFECLDRCIHGELENISFDNPDKIYVKSGNNQAFSYFLPESGLMN